MLDRFPRGKKDEQVIPFRGQADSAINWFWRKLRREAGLEDVRLHDLKHNYASLPLR